MSFDLGSLLGSIIGVIGAFVVAERQYKKSHESQINIEKEMFYRTNKIKTLNENIADLYRLNEMFYSIYEKENELYESLWKFLGKIQLYTFVSTGYDEEEEKLIKELEINESIKQLNLSSFEFDNKEKIQKSLDLLLIKFEILEEYNIDKMKFKNNNEIEYYIEKLEEYLELKEDLENRIEKNKS